MNIIEKRLIAYASLTTLHSDKMFKGNKDAYNNWLNSSTGYKLIKANLPAFFYTIEEEFVTSKEVDLSKKVIDERNGTEGQISLVIDVLNGHHKKRTKLHQIIDYATTHRYSDPIYLQLNSIFELGDTADEIKFTYDDCRRAGIELLIFDYSKVSGYDKYSTCDVNGTPFPNADEIDRQIFSITDEEVKKYSYRGKSTVDFTDRFIDAYFLYESYLISAEGAEIISGMAPNTFHNKYLKMESELYNRNITYHGKPYNYIELRGEWFGLHNVDPKYFRLTPQRFGPIPGAAHNAGFNSSSEIFDKIISEIEFIPEHDISARIEKLKELIEYHELNYFSYENYLRYKTKTELKNKGSFMRICNLLQLDSINTECSSTIEQIKLLKGKKSKISKTDSAIDSKAKREANKEIDAEIAKLGTLLYESLFVPCEDGYTKLKYPVPAFPEIEYEEILA